MAAFERVVLIDDNDADNEYHEIMIRQAGFTGEVRAIENPLEAEPFFRSTDLGIRTCVFLDINMPMLNGFEVAEKLAPILLGHPTVVVMMLTSSASAPDRERATAINVIHGFITKPLTAALAREILMPAG